MTLIGGVDISFLKDDPLQRACACLAILAFPSMRVEWSRVEAVEMREPYIAGFLAFREAPLILPLFEALRTERPELMPQVVVVDGNGTLHPRGCGLASHLGVQLGLPTIGVAKNFLFVGGLTREGVLAEYHRECKAQGDALPVVAEDSGRLLGHALMSSSQGRKPIFVSSGHRVSQQRALDIIRACCKHKIPEPTRQADLISRDWVRKNLEQEEKKKVEEK